MKITINVPPNPFCPEGHQALMSHISLMTREGEMSEDTEGAITFLTPHEASLAMDEGAYRMMPFAIWEDQNTSMAYTEWFFYHDGHLLTSEGHHEMVIA